MAEIQIIEEGWAKKIEAHIGTMAALQDHAMQVGPGPEHESRWNSYVGACHDFLHHLETHFGSAQGFSDFLRGEVRLEFAANALDTALMERYPLWNLIARDDVMKAQAASSLYEMGYTSFMDSAAHKKALHHAAPPPNSIFKQAL